MSDKDKALIDRGWKISCFNWGEIDNLIEQAESPEAKERLRVVRNHKYHEEEYKCSLG